MYPGRMNDVMASVRRTISNYEAALGALRGALGGLAPSIDAAAAAILGMEGRLILAGMGKSGHVARKLAATFASTGTQAHFVHPAEASHGDLGMIGRADVLAMLSWSGETRELGDMIAYAKRFGVTSVAITGAPDSALATRADVSIALPRAAEACPLRLAPTTSTMMQLAIGDALAIAVLEGRGFTAEAFRDFHPGGKLGAALLPVSEIMHRGAAVPLLPEEASILDVLGEIGRKGLGIAGFTDAAGRLAGVMTDGDVRRYLEANTGGTMAGVLTGRAASAVMTRGGVTLAPDRLAATALAVMQERRISAAFVVDEAGRPVGVVQLLQLLGAGVA